MSAVAFSATGVPSARSLFEIHEMGTGDVPAMIPHAREFVYGAALPGGLDEWHYVDHLTKLLELGIGRFAGAWGPAGNLLGAIGLAHVAPIYTSEKVLEELFWYVGADARRAGVGGALKKWAEDLADEIGCGLYMKALAVPGYDKVRDTYEKDGYQPIEFGFFRPPRTRKEV